MQRYFRLRATPRRAIQIRLTAIAVNPPEGESILADRFSGDPLVGSGGALRLNPAEGVEIASADGSAYAGSLDGAVLVVYYSATTRSIPPETTPRKVVVLAGPEKKVS